MTPQRATKRKAPDAAADAPSIVADAAPDPEAVVEPAEVEEAATDATAVAPRGARRRDETPPGPSDDSDISSRSPEAPSRGGQEADTALGASTPTLPPPRTRWAAIIWGLAFAAIAGWALWVVSAVERREDLVVWATSLGPVQIVASIVLAVGTIVLLIGLTALLRRAQRRRE